MIPKSDRHYTKSARLMKMMKCVGANSELMRQTSRPQKRKRLCYTCTFYQKRLCTHALAASSPPHPAGSTSLPVRSSRCCAVDGWLSSSQQSWLHSWYYSSLDRRPHGWQAEEIVSIRIRSKIYTSTSRRTRNASAKNIDPTFIPETHSLSWTPLMSSFWPDRSRPQSSAR